VAPAPVAAPQKAAGENRDSFLGRLLAQLNRFKQYPRAARQARIEGVVMLHFVMDAQGKVQSFEIAKSSGRPVLDAEALALIQRAQPLPALPADYPTRTLDAIVPIEFSLNG
jgi:protein TonB